jgi:hypothetical protein
MTKPNVTWRTDSRSSYRIETVGINRHEAWPLLLLPMATRIAFVELYLAGQAMLKAYIDISGKPCKTISI